VERMRGRDPLNIPAMLIKYHGPVTWAGSVSAAVETAIVLEQVAMMAWHTEMLLESESGKQIGDPLLNKHFNTKSGPNASYGQTQNKD